MLRIGPYLGTLCAAALWIALLTGSALGLQQIRGGLLQTFATCAGRLSATVEFQWIFGGSAAEPAERSVNGFDLLIEAVIGSRETAGSVGRDLLNWRIDAKIAQSRLLNQSAFGQDPRLRRHAARAAKRYQQECEQLLLN